MNMDEYKRLTFNIQPIPIVLGKISIALDKLIYYNLNALKRDKEVNQRQILNLPIKT